MVRLKVALAERPAYHQSAASSLEIASGGKQLAILFGVHKSPSVRLDGGGGIKPLLLLELQESDKPKACLDKQNRAPYLVIRFFSDSREYACPSASLNRYGRGFEVEKGFLVDVSTETRLNTGGGLVFSLKLEELISGQLASIHGL